MKFRKILIVCAALFSSLVLTGCISSQKTAQDSHAPDDNTKTQSVDSHIHAMRFRNPACRKNIPWCQEKLTREVLTETAVKDFIKTADDQDIQSFRQNNIYTIMAMNIGQSSIICCDIQANFQKFEIEGGNNFLIARFRLPQNAAIETRILGRKDFHKKINIGNDELVSLYFDTFAKDNYETFSKVTEFPVSGFDRKVFLYRTQPTKKPDFIVYFKDGGGLKSYTQFLEAYWQKKGATIPNIAIVGIESAASRKRTHEYVKGFGGGKSTYNAYQAVFRDKIVPEVESHLQYEAGKTGRILFGTSNGAAWSLSHLLDYPEFVCQAIVLSYVGNIPKEMPPADKCKKVYLAAGVLEEATLKRTLRLAEKLKNSEYDVRMTTKASGHSTVLWVPYFAVYLQAATQ